MIERAIEEQFVMSKCTEKKTSAEIINYVNDVLTKQLLPRTIRRCLPSCGLTRR